MIRTLLKGALRASTLVLAAGLLTVSAPAAKAQDQMLGEVKLFGFNFCPRGWANANGALLAISSNQALFSLYGTFYGGDGRTSFALPDLRGRVALNVGTGPGLSSITMGQTGGIENKTLVAQEMPVHSHQVNATNAVGDQRGPSDDFLADPPNVAGEQIQPYHDGPANVQMNPGMIASAGGGLSFSIRNPFVGMTWCVATTGIFPSRS